MDTLSNTDARTHPKKVTLLVTYDIKITLQVQGNNDFHEEFFSVNSPRIHVEMSKFYEIFEGREYNWIFEDFLYEYLLFDDVDNDKRFVRFNIMQNIKRHMPALKAQMCCSLVLKKRYIYMNITLWNEGSISLFDQLQVADK